MRHLKLSASTRIGILCLLGVAMCAGVAAATTLTGMSVSTEGEVTKIHVMLDEPVEYSHFALSDPSRLFLDCRGVDVILPKNLPSGTGRAGGIQASVWNGDGNHAMTRITIDMTGSSAAEVKQVEGGLLVVLKPEGDGGEWETDSATAPETEAEAEKTPAEVWEATKPASQETSAETATETATETAAEATPRVTAPAKSTEAAVEKASETTTPVETVTEEAPATPVKETVTEETPKETYAEAPVKDTMDVPTLSDLGVEADVTSPDAADAKTIIEDTEKSEKAVFDYRLPEDELLERFTGHREPTVATFEMSSATSLAGRSGARVSLDIQGADIYTVLRSISEYSGVNIVMGYDVRTEISEPLSFHLENVPWGEALEMVLRSAHLWYREEGNIVRVDTEENLRKEELARTYAERQLEEVMPLNTRIVEVIYAQASELKPSIEKTLSKRGVLEVDNRTNSLLVTDIAARVEAAVDMIRHLDSQTPQVEIVAKMVDVDSRFIRELGVLWTGSNTSGDVTATDMLLGSNDIIEPNANVRFGLVKSWGSVNALLSAMEQENKANIISNPRVTTVNNRMARILVGKKIPLIVLDEAGNAVTQLITIGITLRVTPHINDNNRITLDMHPEVSDLAAQATVQGGVIINTSEADTRVMVENGQTAVIAGLIRANDTVLERGVPILKDIPLLGSFFKSTSNVREKRELLIFVTPRIITSLASQD